MSVLSLYIFRQITLIFLILVGVLTGLVWVSQAIRFLNLVIEKGRGLGEFLLLTGYMVPSIVGLVSPTALFIATIFVLHRLNTDNELAVIQAAGGSQWRLLRPFVAVTALVTVFIIFVNLYAMPHGMRAFREKLISVRTDLISTLVQEGQFVSPEAGLTVHIRAQDANGDLLGLLFHDTRKSDGRITYLAERARIVTSDAGTSLVMFNGTFQRRRETAKDVDVVRFKEYTLDLDTFGPDRKVPYYQASEKFMSELLNPDPKDPVFIDHPGKIFAEIHERFSSPLYALTMMLIAFVGLSEAKTNRTGRIWVIFGILGLATGVRLLGGTSINMMIKTNALYPLAYAIPLLAILTVLTYMVFHNRADKAYYAMVRNRAARRSRQPQPGPQKSPAPEQVPNGPTPVRSSMPPRPDAPPATRRPSPLSPRPSSPGPSSRPTSSSNRPATSTQMRNPDPSQALRHLAQTLSAPKRTGKQQVPITQNPMNPTQRPPHTHNPPAKSASPRPPSMVPQRPAPERGREPDQERSRQRSPGRGPHPHKRQK